MLMQTMPFILIVVDILIFKIMSKIVIREKKVYLPYSGCIGMINYSTITKNYFYEGLKDSTPLFRSIRLTECIDNLRSLIPNCIIADI